MILKNNSLDERCLEIFEEDLINDEEILVLRIYCTKRNNGLWEMPEPQIINENLYEKYKTKYDEKILAFRNDCENLTVEKGSILASEVENLKTELTVTQEALNEILFGGV